MAQLVEHVIGNDEVISSTLITSSRSPISIEMGLLVFSPESRRGQSSQETHFEIGHLYKKNAAALTSRGDLCYNRAKASFFIYFIL